MLASNERGGGRGVMKKTGEIMQIHNNKFSHKKRVLTRWNRAFLFSPLLAFERVQTLTLVRLYACTFIYRSYAESTPRREKDGAAPSFVEFTPFSIHLLHAPSKLYVHDINKYVKSVSSKNKSNCYFI